MQKAVQVIFSRIIIRFLSFRWWMLSAVASGTGNRRGWPSIRAACAQGPCIPIAPGLPTRPPARVLDPAPRDSCRAAGSTGKQPLKINLSAKCEQHVNILGHFFAVPGIVIPVTKNPAGHHAGERRRSLTSLPMRWTFASSSITFQTPRHENDPTEFDEDHPVLFCEYDGHEPPGCPGVQKGQ